MTTFLLGLLPEGTEHDKPQQITQDVHVFVRDAEQAFCTRRMQLCHFLLCRIEML